MQKLFNQKINPSLLFKASEGTHSDFIKVSWTSVIGVDRYFVTRAPSKEGPFKLIKTVEVDPENQPAMLHLHDMGVKGKQIYHYEIMGYAAKSLRCRAQDQGYRGLLENSTFYKKFGENNNG